jgi:hypothetical protein
MCKRFCTSKRTFQSVEKVIFPLDITKSNSNSRSKKMATFAEKSNVVFQVGTMLEPAQILTLGGQFDAKKKVNSCRVVVCDQASIEAIRKLEADTQAANPQSALNSVIGVVGAHPISGQAGYEVRVKMTKNEKCYRADKPWTSGAAPDLSLLGHGHTVIMKCRSSSWKYEDSCGITIYANIVKGIGANVVPWGAAQSDSQPAPISWD